MTVPCLPQTAHGGGHERGRPSTFGIYQFHPHSEEVMVRERLVRLTHKEFSLALMLFGQVGELVLRATILSTLWADDEGASRSLDTYICRLRKLLELKPANGFLLSTVYRRGYRLDNATLSAEAVFDYCSLRRRR